MPRETSEYLNLLGIACLLVGVERTHLRRLLTVPNTLDRFASS